MLTEVPIKEDIFASEYQSCWLEGVPMGLSTPLLGVHDPACIAVEGIHNDVYA